MRQRFPAYTPGPGCRLPEKPCAAAGKTRTPNNTWGHGFAKLPSPDREALEALYNATGGANWLETTNWMTSSTLSTWHGVATDNEGRVTELDLTRNQLKGEIPPELADLTTLRCWPSGGNELTGEIPAELGQPRQPGRTVPMGERTDWHDTGRTGQPRHWSQLQVSENQLTGEIPVELGSLANLEELYLWGNELTGTMPAELGSLANLVQTASFGEPVDRGDSGGIGQPRQPGRTCTYGVTN